MIKIKREYGDITITNDAISSIIKEAIREVAMVELSRNLIRDVASKIGVKTEEIRIESEFNKLIIGVELKAEMGSVLTTKGYEVQRIIHEMIDRLTTVAPYRVDVLFTQIY